MEGARGGLFIGKYTLGDKGKKEFSAVIETCGMDKVGNQKWWKKKRIWVGIASVLLLALFISTLPSELPRKIGYLAKAYSEPEICEGALEIASRKPKVLEILGDLDPMGYVDMLNGSVGYSKGGDAVAITIDVRGDKEIDNIRSKMDVVAFKVKRNWDYQEIKIRIKQPPELKQTILILKK